MKKILVLVSVAVVALVVGFLVGKGSVSTPVGVTSGTDYTERQYFKAGATEGGVMSTTSTATTYTIAARDLNGAPSVILWNPSQNTTLSLGATSTRAYVPNVGDVANVYLLNASTTAASSITFAAVDANSDLQFTEATGGDLVLNGLDWVKMTIIRQTGYKVTFILDEMTEAD